MSAIENESVPRSTAAAGDEIHDAGRPELAPDHPLGTVLAFLGSALVPVFDAADSAAKVHQARHRRLTSLAAGAGALAIVLTVIRMALLSLGVARWLAWGLLLSELFAAIAAVILILVGLIGRSGRDWLLERHRAERCRLLKFRFLLDPLVWSRREGDAEERRRAFSRDVEELSSLGYAQMNEWLRRDTVPSSPTVPVGSGIPQRTIHSVMDYYESRRLTPQLDYLARRLSGRDRRDRRAIPWGPIFFVTSVAAVLAHGVLEITHLEQDLLPRGILAAVVASLILGAGLPAISAAIRSWRLSNDFGRGTVRFEARQFALRQLAERMSKADGNEAIFRELNFCEDVIESDNREWFRFMSDAEWFG